MLFTTWTFACLLLITLGVYYVLPRLGKGGEAQIGVLVVSSLIFYAFEVPALVFLLLISILINAYLSIRVIRAQSEGRSCGGWVTSAVVINLLLLGFFKYAGFLADSFIPKGTLEGLVSSLDAIPLPVGISFYTFQAISLLVDLKRDKLSTMSSLRTLVEEKKDFQAMHRIGFYIAFFPQLVAGPIVKAHDFFHQISAKHLKDLPWEKAIKCLVAGYFLKMVVADNLKEVTVLLEQGTLTKRLDLIGLVYGYSCQIFADFAGYSLIAIGLGALFGYELPTNFNFPYISASITEFWRRWHISLSTWLKEYLYFPLGGNRKGAMRTYVNLFIVMLLGGLWHGAAWGYLIWGAAHGILLAIERLCNVPVTESRMSLSRVIKSLVVFHVVSLLWLLFLMPDFGHVIGFFKSFAAGSWSGSAPTLFTVLLFSSPVILYHLFAFARETFGAERVTPRESLVRWGYALLLFLIVTNSGTTGAFVYFQF